VSDLDNHFYQKLANVREPFACNPPWKDPVQWIMAAKEKGAIGIDIGGTKVLFALFDEKFKVVDRIKEKTSPEKGEKRFSELLTESLETLAKRAEKENIRLLAVGVGSAGAIDDEKGQIVESPNIPFLKGYSLRAKIEKVIDAEVAIGNDVQMGLYGEMCHGAAQNAKNIICVFLGTGIGGALAIDGKLYLGASGTAGEIGHYMTDPMGALSGSDRQGLLDDLVSRNAIAAEAAMFANKQWAPHLFKLAGTNVADIKSGTIAEAIKNGDEKIEELVRSRSRILGIVLSNLADFLDPDLVLLGGGLVDEMPEIIVKEVEKGIRAHTVPSVAKNVKVQATKLEDVAVAAGAAQLALDKAALATSSLLRVKG
jgi:glucokinase